MTILDASNSQSGFQMDDYDVFEFASQDPGGLNFPPVAYSWLSTGGHSYQVTGAGITTNGVGMPVSGTVSAFSIDLNNNGHTDVTASDVGGASLTDMVGGLASFHSSILGGNDQITGSDFADYLRGAGGNDTINGGAGHDQVFGHGDNDVLAGGAGNDIVKGGSGNDLLIDDNGIDMLYGQAGDDTVQVNSAISQDSFDGGTGNDWIDFSAKNYVGGANINLNAGVVSHDGKSEDMVNFENAIGSQGGDTIIGTNDANVLKGAGGADRIEGRGGNDTMSGENGKDTLIGGAGEDQLSGDNGADDVRGGNGKDTVAGGDGADILTGGKGNDRLFGDMDGDHDVFVYKNNFDKDRIMDFEDGVDQIDLSNFGFANAAEAKSFAVNQNGNVKFDFGDGDVLIVEDISKADLTNADFIL